MSQLTIFGIQTGSGKQDPGDTSGTWIAEDGKVRVEIGLVSVRVTWKPDVIHRGYELVLTGPSRSNPKAAIDALHAAVKELAARIP